MLGDARPTDASHGVKTSGRLVQHCAGHSSDKRLLQLRTFPMADSDSDDDQTWSKTYREDESNLLISSKEADFRTFLCDSGASEEVCAVGSTIKYTAAAEHHTACTQARTPFQFGK